MLIKRRSAVYLAALVFIGSVAAIGCGARAVPSVLSAADNAAVIRHSDQGLDVLLAPYTGEQEQQAFGVNLQENGIMAVEMKFVRNADGAGVLKVRRTGVRAQFSNGSKRDALDPRKVYERHRINAIPAAVAFGLIGAAIANSEDSKRRDAFHESGFTSAQLDDHQPEASGFVFFDVTGIHDPALAAVDLEFEDSSTASLHATHIDVKTSMATP